MANQTASSDGNAARNVDQIFRSDESDIKSSSRISQGSQAGKSSQTAKTSQSAKSGNSSSSSQYSKSSQTSKTTVSVNQNTQVSKAAAQNTSYRQEESKEIDLVEVFFALLSNWKALVLGVLIGAVLFGVYQVFFITPTYKASAELYITSNDSVISLQDLQIGAALTEDYKKIIVSRTVLNQVIDDLGLDTNYKGLANMISVSNPSNTHIIEIGVTTSNFVLSRDIANDLLNVSIDRLYQVIGTNEPSIIDYSQAEAVEEATPSLKRNMLIGGLVGLVLVAAVIIIRMLSNTTIRTDDDVDKLLHLPILAVVPYYEE